MANEARVRSIKMTREGLEMIDRLAESHGQSRGDLMRRMVEHFVALKDEAAQAFALGLAPNYARALSRAAFLKAVERLTK